MSLRYNWFSSFIIIWVGFILRTNLNFCTAFDISPISIASTKSAKCSSNSKLSLTYSPKIKRSVSFIIYQEPRPLSRHMTAKGFMYNPSAKDQKLFLDESKPFLPMKPWEGPIEMNLDFYFSRPKTHFRTGKLKHLLKPTAPSYHSGRKDLDNLIKFVLDALNKHAYLDDGQVVCIKSRKFYVAAASNVEVDNNSVNGVGQIDSNSNYRLINSSRARIEVMITALETEAVFHEEEE